MPTMKEAATAFLESKRIAVTGVSRSSKDHGANTVFRRLRDRGYEVFAINPNTEEVEGGPSYHDLGSVPGGVDAVVIGTRPAIVDDTMRECAGARYPAGVDAPRSGRGECVGDCHGLRPSTWHHGD